MDTRNGQTGKAVKAFRAAVILARHEARWVDMAAAVSAMSQVDRGFSWQSGETDCRKCVGPVSYWHAGPCCPKCDGESVYDICGCPGCFSARASEY